MANIRKLEQIIFKEDKFWKAASKIPVKPTPVGKPIEGIVVRPDTFEVYGIIRKGAKKQKVWNYVNAYSCSIKDYGKFFAVAAQLYQI